LLFATAKEFIKLIQVFENLYVGDDTDYLSNHILMNKDWRVVHACKEPYHRKALGYQTRGAPKGPYYYFVYDNYNHLILNIVDGVPCEFYNNEMIDEAIAYCISGLESNHNVLIHCNQGESRAPSIAMLVLKKLNVLPHNFDVAYSTFKSLYPNFIPSSGILEYLCNKWKNGSDDL